MTKLISTIFILFIGLNSVLAQTAVNGQITDAVTGNPIPYANLGIEDQNLGTVSGRDGRFKLQIPDSLAHLPLTISFVGYESQHIRPAELQEAIIKLEPKETILHEVTIDASTMKDIKAGVRKYTPMAVATYSGQPNDIAEIAQLIKLSRKRMYVEKVNLHAFGSNTDSLYVRVNLYKEENGQPGELLNKEAIYFEKKAEKGWLTFDLSEYNVQVEENFYIALEILPVGVKDEKANIQLGCNIFRKGAHARSSSHGNWKEIGVGITMYVEGQYEKL